MILHKHPDWSVKVKLRKLSKLKHKKGQVSFRNVLGKELKLSPYHYAIRHYLSTDWWFLARVGLGMHWVDQELHGKKLLSHYLRPCDDPDMCVAEGFTDHFDKATLIPRGHIKTLFLGCSLQILRLLNNPRLQIMYASATEGLARDVGTFISNHFTNNSLLQESFPDILPSSRYECTQWGSSGYRLPCHEGKDPNFIAASLKTNVTGAHPDIMVLDDLIVEQTNNPEGWEKAEQFIKNGLALLPPHGWFEYLATRWHDADTSSKILSGQIRGKQGPFSCLVESCYVNDREELGPIWGAKKRFDSKQTSGYTTKQLQDMRFTMGAFFNAQMRNDPLPEEDAIIRIDDINIIPAGETPTHGKCKAVGVEVTGGGRVLFNLIRDELKKLSIKMPLIELITRRNTGLTKADRIAAVMEPLIREGRLWVKPWMLPQNDADEGNLGYELKRLGVAKHDDIADALHSGIEQLMGGVRPMGSTANHFYITSDLGWTEKARSDWSVCIAFCVDTKGNVYVIDYDRFQSNSPQGIAARVIQFYRKHESSSVTRRKGSQRKSIAQRYR